jgi:hypothetical protein
MRYVIVGLVAALVGTAVGARNPAEATELYTKLSESIGIQEYLPKLEQGLAALIASVLALFGAIKGSGPILERFTVGRFVNAIVGNGTLPKTDVHFSDLRTTTPDAKGFFGFANLSDRLAIAVKFKNETLFDQIVGEGKRIHARLTRAVNNVLANPKSFMKLKSTEAADNMVAMKEHLEKVGPSLANVKYADYATA